MRIKISKENIKDSIKRLRNHQNFRLYAAAVITFALLFAFTFLSRQIRIWTAPPSNQSDYEYFNATHQYLSFTELYDLDYMSVVSDLVAEVTIGKIHDAQLIEYFCNPSYEGEPLEDRKLKQRLVKIDIQIEDTIRGGTSDRITNTWVMKYGNLFDPGGMDQYLKTGDRMIIFFHKNGTLEGYAPTDFSYAFFHVSQDGKVYPVSDEVPSEYSGMKISEFKRRIRNAKFDLSEAQKLIV